VSDGYGRNYLIPRGLAEVATPKAIAEAGQRRQQSEAAATASAAEWNAMRERLTGLSVTVTAAANADGTLFGALPESAILTAVHAAGISLPTSGVEIAEPIKHTGNHQVRVAFPDGTAVELTVSVQPKNA
jgi:large subunit ribosomal protein L9